MSTEIAAEIPVPHAAATDGEGRLPALPVTPFRDAPVACSAQAAGVGEVALAGCDLPAPSIGTAVGPEFLAYLAMAAHENSAGLHPGAALYAPYFFEYDDSLHGHQHSQGDSPCVADDMRDCAKVLRGDNA